AGPSSPASGEPFCDAGAPYGLDGKSPFCVYGMAEATLAISFPVPGTGMSVDVVERHALEHDRLALPAANGDGRRLPMLGRTLRGLELRACRPATGREARDRAPRQ